MYRLKNSLAQGPDKYRTATEARRGLVFKQMHGNTVVLAEFLGKQGRTGRLNFILGQVVSLVHHLINFLHDPRGELTLGLESKVGGNGAIVPEHVEQLRVGLGDAVEVRKIIDLFG